MHFDSHSGYLLNAALNISKQLEPDTIGSASDATGMELADANHVQP